MLFRVLTLFAALSIAACGGGGDADTTGASGNQPPTIGGTPPSQITIDSTYDYTPVASDPEGVTLTFTIDAQPTWANFDSGSGRLWGTPGAGDENTYSGIRITASDGTNTATLGPFAINVVTQAQGSVNLAWKAPTTNADGTQLQDLAGFNVYYGPSAIDMPNVDRIENATVSSHLVENLAPGEWFFSVTAFDLADNESVKSNVISWTYSP